MIKRDRLSAVLTHLEKRQHTMIKNKTIAILMAAHTRLGNESTLPNDIVVMIARVFHDQARREEVQAKWTHIIAKNILLMDYPHTVDTVADVLGWRLLASEKSWSSDFAREVFKRLHNGQQPVSCEMDGIIVDRYNDYDLWILNDAVQRHALGCELRHFA